MYYSLLLYPLNFLKHWSGTILNTGHTLKFDPYNKPDGGYNTPRINKGPLKWYSYDLLQVHFHWGSHGGQGSEHRIDDFE